MSMRKLKRSDVEHLAKLANLQLTNEEITKFQKQLSDIISYIGLLNKVNTDNIDPFFNITDLNNVCSTDLININGTLGQNEAVSQSKKAYDKYFIVPMVLEDKTI